MRAATVSLTRDEHPPLHVTFSAAFYRLPGPEQVSALRTLAHTFSGLTRAASSSLKRGFLPPIHKLKGCLPHGVRISIGRTR